MLQPFATLEQFDARIPGGIESSQQARAQALLEDASSIIRAEAGEDWEDGAPDIVVTVCIAASKRAFLNPDGVRALSVDNYSESFSNASPDVYLTEAEKRLIRKVAGKTGVWTQGTTRGGPDVPSVTDADPDVHDSGPASEFF